MKEENENITETIVETDSQQESNASNKQVSKTAKWARAHKGFIQVLDPELRAQMVNFR